MKKILLTLIILFYIARCFAQDTLEVKNDLADGVIEKYHVIKGAEQVKTGLYQALYKRKIAIASGRYENGKKVGTWFFFDKNGLLMQNFNYTTGKLKYEAPETINSDLRYLVDKTLNDTDKSTKPIKIGGRYFGYLPYLNLYKTPFEPYDIATSTFVGVVQLLISPLGRLAEYKVRIVSNYYQYDKTITMDLNLFKEEDKQFIPATLNNEPIQSIIVITCRLTNSGGLDFF